VVTLSPLAQEIISEQRMITSSTSPYVFESTTKLGHAITGDALMRALDRLQKRKLAELEPFSVHDLRRSVANCCGIELGAGPLEIEHMLNHQISDKLLRTYQAGALRNPEKLRSLFLRWGDIVKHQIAQYEVEKSSDVMGNVIQGTFGKR
jgi:integrase